MIEAFIAGIAVVLAAVLPVLLSQRKKVNETHRMLTVNHHSSELEGKDPTVLDRLEDLKDLFSEHIKASDAITQSHKYQLEHLNRDMTMVKSHILKD